MARFRGTEPHPVGSRLLTASRVCTVTPAVIRPVRDTRLEA
jgi:hypothetical protein